MRVTTRTSTWIGLVGLSLFAWPSVTTGGGESEKFLFYRGVGNIQAPLRISREADHLVVRGQVDAAIAAKAPLKIPVLWLTEIHADGQVAFRKLAPMDLSLDPHRVLMTLPASFHTSDFSAQNLKVLRASLLQSLMGEGDLGRFRNALLLDEEKRRPTEGLTGFIKCNGLKGLYQASIGPPKKV